MLRAAATIWKIITDSKRSRELSLSDICKEAIKLTVIGGIGYVLAIVFLILEQQAPGGTQGMYVSLPLMVALGLSAGVAIYTYARKAFIFFSNIDRIIDMLKIFMVDIFAAIFIAVTNLCSQALKVDGSYVLGIGLGAHYIIAWLYHIYCRSAYKKGENEQKGKK